MDGMKDGMMDVMREKFNGMMQMGDGKQDMMQMMGMTGGKDKNGNDMKQKFDGKMTMKKGQSGGPMDSQKFKDMKGGKEGGPSMKNYNGGCAVGLCCGHTLEYGVWKESYFCFDQYA